MPRRDFSRGGTQYAIPPAPNDSNTTLAAAHTRSAGATQSLPATAEQLPRGTVTKPTPIRLPDEVLSELDRRARARGKDRATLLRELLQDAVDRDTVSVSLEDWMDSESSRSA